MTKGNTHVSILASLRALRPDYQLDFDGSRHLAERQAELLGRRLNGDISEATIAGLPRIHVVHEPLPTSGLSYWNGQDWIIALNGGDTLPRQRYTLLHEFKHIIDHGATAKLYRSQWEAERAADYFAACALMPKPALKRVFCTITQDVLALAEHFGVSQSAIRVRLEQTGLVDADMFTRERCARPIRTPRYQTQRFLPVTMRRAS